MDKPAARWAVGFLFGPLPCWRGRLGGFADTVYYAAPHGVADKRVAIRLETLISLGETVFGKRVVWMWRMGDPPR